MNDLVSLLGIEAWKPLLAALALPPVPLLLLVLVGTRLVFSRRGLGWTLVLFATAGLWLTACTGSADLLARTPLLRPPPALSQARIAQLRAEARAHPSAIVALGGGRVGLAPETGSADLKPRSLERLRYALWLQRETALPVAFSGGTGWADPAGPSEAEIAARVAARDFGAKIKWTETESRDTRENARRSVALLEPEGVRRIVLVTHGWHMPRAKREFEAAAAGRIEIVAAPMALAPLSGGGVLAWLPSPEGFARVHEMLREALARLAASV